MFTGPGDRVVVDHPTYPLAIAAIQGASCRPVGVSLPQTGWDIDGFAATLAQTAPRLAYLMPDFHNPTGRCMDATSREAIAAIAAHARTTLVVDETMVDLWFDAPPPPPLASFCPNGNVITLGSAGKMFLGRPASGLGACTSAHYRGAGANPRYARSGIARCLNSWPPCG